MPSDALHFGASNAIAELLSNAEKERGWVLDNTLYHPKRIMKKRLLKFKKRSWWLKRVMICGVIMTHREQD
jgi:hypothetical protein